MVVDLIGLLDDGSERSPRVPASARAAVEVFIGVTTTFRLTIKTVGGIPYKPTGTVKLAVKRSYLDSRPLVELTGSRPVGAEPNRLDFTLLPAATKPLAPGRYIYDVMMVVSGTNRQPLIPISSLRLLPSVSLP